MDHVVLAFFFCIPLMKITLPVILSFLILLLKLLYYFQMHHQLGYACQYLSRSMRTRCDIITCIFLMWWFFHLASLPKYSPFPCRVEIKRLTEILNSKVRNPSEVDRERANEVTTILGHTAGVKLNPFPRIPDEGNQEDGSRAILRTPKPVLCPNVNVMSL